jgi:hypothetical protein
VFAVEGAEHVREVVGGGDLGSFPRELGVRGADEVALSNHQGTSWSPSEP